MNCAKIMGGCAFVCSLLVSTFGYAAAESSGIYRPPVRVTPTDIPALQRGYKVFIENCVACHSLSLMRYNRVAQDLAWSEEAMREQGLILQEATINDYITTKLDPEDAKATYGVVPPNLSLKARERGVDWIHGFLMSYYQDGNSKTGFNNAVMPGTAMPNILAGKQGMQQPVFNDNADSPSLVGLKLASDGALNSKEFYEEMRDLVSFLRYASEPAILQRYALGPWVIGFLLILLLVTWLLKRDYWRDVKNNKQ